MSFLVSFHFLLQLNTIMLLKATQKEDKDSKESKWKLIKYLKLDTACKLEFDLQKCNSIFIFSGIAYRCYSSPFNSTQLITTRSYWPSHKRCHLKVFTLEINSTPAPKQQTMKHFPGVKNNSFMLVTNLEKIIYVAPTPETQALVSDIKLTEITTSCHFVDVYCSGLETCRTFWTT